MKQGANRSRYRASLSAFELVLRELARGRRFSPKAAPAFRAFWHRVNWGLLLLLLGMVVQACLAVLVWQLIELCIELFEAWVILARASVGL